jgi:uncharacterized protein (TIGR01777 family)
VETTTRQWSTALPASAEAAYLWHTRPGAFERLQPPWEDVRVLSRRGGIEDRGEVVLMTRLGPLRLTWIARHTDFEAGRTFRDVQVSGPFAEWQHTHRFDPAPGGGSLLTDEVQYALPLGALGRAVAGGFVQTKLERMFRYRHATTRNDMSRHAEYAGQGPKRIAITGATGLVGGALAPFLSTGGHTVHRVVRRPPPVGSADVQWDPATGAIDAQALEGVSAVVHLAGENVAGGRWTPARKAAIRDSRARGTALLARTLAGLARPPEVLVSASAVGYYGDGGDSVLTEASPRGDDFLAEVCGQWEDGTRAAEDAGIRVVHVRIGVVLDPRGGVLGRLLPIFGLGGGGRVGSGRQYMSWIAMDDLLAVLHRAVMDERMRGAYNATSPNPVRNGEFTATLARVLHRPAVLPVPALAVKLAFGEMGESVLLAGQRALPERLLALGHSFEHPELEGALRHLLGR